MPRPPPPNEALLPPRGGGTVLSQTPSQNIRQQKCYQSIQSQLRYAAPTLLGQPHRLEVRQSQEAVLPKRVVGHAIGNLAGIETRRPGFSDDATPHGRNRSATQRFHHILS